MAEEERSRPVGAPAEGPRPGRGGGTRSRLNLLAGVAVIAGGVMLISVLLTWITVEFTATDVTGGSATGSATVTGLGSITGTGLLAGTSARVNTSFSVIVMASAVLTAVLGVLLTFVNRRPIAYLGVLVALLGGARAAIEMIQDLTQSTSTDLGVTGKISLNAGIYLYVAAAAVALVGFFIASRRART